MKLCDHCNKPTRDGHYVPGRGYTCQPKKPKREIIDCPTCGGLGVVSRLVEPEPERPRISPWKAWKIFEAYLKEPPSFALLQAICLLREALAALKEGEEYKPKRIPIGKVVINRKTGEVVERDLE